MLASSSCFQLDIFNFIIGRWKERYIVVTRDYLQCYKRVATEASQMGPFLNQVFTHLPYFVGFCREKWSANEPIKSDAMLGNKSLRSAQSILPTMMRNKIFVFKNKQKTKL